MNIKLKYQNQRGFALMSLLAFFPFLIALMVILGYAGKHLVTQSKALHQCRQKLINTQSKIGIQLEKLLALNPKAQRLRQQRESANSALALALANSPQLVPMAKIALRAITIKQAQLRY